jgi:uncharacterized protein YceH (UPF0502 family)
MRELAYIQRNNMNNMNCESNIKDISALIKSMSGHTGDTYFSYRESGFGKKPENKWTLRCGEYERCGVSMQGVTFDLLNAIKTDLEKKIESSERMAVSYRRMLDSIIR